MECDDDPINSEICKRFEKEKLHFAAANGDLEKIKALLAQDYPINAFDDLSWTPLHHAAKERTLR